MNTSEVTLAISFSVLFSVVLLGGMAIIIYTAHRTRLRHQLKLAKAQMEYEQELRTVATEVQEQMLSNLSGELHDNIGQRLTLVHFQLEAQRNGIKPEVLQQANQNLVDAMKEVRQLSHALNADVLKRQGICTMISQEVRRLAQNGQIDIRYDKPPQCEPLLGPDQQLMVFRLFQEAVNNCLKHARASTLSIRLESSPSFMLEIRDDGIGCDLNDVLNGRNGAGLNNMKQRAQLAGLNCHMESRPGHGCVVRVEKTAF